VEGGEERGGADGDSLVLGFIMQATGHPEGDEKERRLTYR